MVRKISQDNYKKKIIRKMFLNSFAAYVISDIPLVIAPLIDSAVIANFLGIRAVAAVGLFAPFMLLYLMIAGIITGGSRNVYANLIGKGEIEQGNFIFSFSIILLIILSITFSLVSIIFSKQLAICLGAYGAHSYLAPDLEAYICGMSPGIVFVNLARFLNGFMHFDKDTQRSVYSLIIMTAVNIVLDFYVVKYTYSGIFGIGLATTISNLVWLLVLLCHFLRKDKSLKFLLKSKVKIVKCIQDVFVNGSSVIVIRISKILARLLVNHMLMMYSTGIALAVLSAQKSILNLVGSAYIAGADTVWALSGIFYGEEDRNALKELQNISIKVGLIVATSVSVTLVLLARVLTKAYLGRYEFNLYEMGIESIRMVAIALPILTLSYIFGNYMIGTKHIKQSNLYFFMYQFGFFVPVSYILIRMRGGRGAYVALPVVAFLTLLLALIIIYTYDRNQPLNERRLLLDKKKVASKVNEIEFTANSMKEILGTSGMVSLFCKENNLSSKSTNTISLCVEEICSSIIKNRFDDKKEYSINIRVVIKELETILRIRDDCELFNPISIGNINEENDIEQSVNSIKLVTGLSKSANYISVYNTNSIIIKVPN
ncbi:MAG: hypothetical protein J6P02_06245 [Lachnospiraceae bacterium]|nr:hypothetical protein [Lachnospiraceae bacterium]